MIKLRVLGMVLAISMVFGAIAHGAEKAPSKHGKSHKAKQDKQEVTYIDASGPSAPESEFPDQVKKGPL